MEGAKKIKVEKIVMYLAVVLAVAILLLLAFFPGVIQAFKDSGKSAGDKCKPAPGYTEQEWIEHMGHHPDIYKECLNKN